MTLLQIVLLVAGLALVLVVLIYNVIQMRAVKSRRSASTRGETAPHGADDFREPTLRSGAPAPSAPTPPASSSAPAEPTAPTPSTVPTATHAESTPSVPKEAPDFMAEAVLTLQLPETINITPDLAQQIMKTPGNRVRFFWQPQDASHWTLLHSVSDILDHLENTPSHEASASEEGEALPDESDPAPVHSLAFCLQLADRSQAVTPEQLEVFQKHVESVASLLSASYTPFDVALEADRAKTLDKTCADLDLQIGLTLHGKIGPLQGQQLLHAAQKLGFVLEKGALRYHRDDHEVFRIESHDGSALSEERLKKAIQDPVLLLDVPQTYLPEQSFDEMLKLAAQLAQTLPAQLVDDRQRLVNEQGLALIRTEICKASQALRAIGIEPGSPRALRLFTA